MAFTFFFRDNTVLEAAADLFVAETMGRSRVRIWDAGCAMGPEPYTLLIMIAERMGRFSFENLRLDATDHDESGFFGEIITAGRYPEEQLCRIPGSVRGRPEAAFENHLPAA
jgi:chemotaxis protein methyltransferase CheR